MTSLKNAVLPNGYYLTRFCSVLYVQLVELKANFNRTTKSAVHPSVCIGEQQRYKFIAGEIKTIFHWVSTHGAGIVRKLRRIRRSWREKTVSARFPQRRAVKSERSQFQLYPSQFRWDFSATLHQMPYWSLCPKNLVSNRYF